MDTNYLAFDVAQAYVFSGMYYPHTVDKQHDVYFKTSRMQRMITDARGKQSTAYPAPAAVLIDPGAHKATCFF